MKSWAPGFLYTSGVGPTRPAIMLAKIMLGPVAKIMLKKKKKQKKKKKKKKKLLRMLEKKGCGI